MVCTYQVDVTACGQSLRVQLRPTRANFVAGDDTTIRWSLPEGQHLYLADGQGGFSDPPGDPAFCLPPSTSLDLTVEGECEGDAPQLWLLIYPPSGEPFKPRIKINSRAPVAFTTPTSPDPLPVRIALRLHGTGVVGRTAIRLQVPSSPATANQSGSELRVGPLGQFRVVSPFYAPAGYMAYGPRHHRYYDDRPPTWYASFVRDLKGRERLLDLGTGPGLLLDAAQALGIPNVLGVERDAHFHSLAKHHGRNVVLHDLNEPMPFIPSRSRDAITAHQVFDYLERTALLGIARESARILAIGGMLKFHMRCDGRASGDETRSPRPTIDAETFEELGFNLIEFRRDGNTLRAKMVLARDIFTWPASAKVDPQFGPFDSPTPCLRPERAAWDNTGDRDFTPLVDEAKRAVRHGERLHAVYTGYRVSGSDKVSRAVMLAESTDGVAWSRTAVEPVLKANASDPDEAGGLAAGSLIAGRWPEAPFALFYSCRSTAGTWPGIKRALSHDLQHWRSEPGWVLHRDQFRSLRHLALADVVRLSNGIWLMHCEGWAEGGGWAIYQARSADGLDWQPLDRGPVVSANIFPWAQGHIANPKCFETEPGRLLLGVNAAPANLQFRLAFLDSAEGTAWRPVGPPKLLSPGSGQYRLESLFSTVDQWRSDGRVYFFAAGTKQTHLSSRSLTTARSAVLSYLGEPWAVDEPSLFLVDSRSGTLRVCPAAEGISAAASQPLPPLADIRLMGRLLGGENSPANAGVGLAGKEGRAVTINPRGELESGDEVLFRPAGQPSEVAFAMTVAGRTAKRPELIVRLWLDGHDALWIQIPVSDDAFDNAVILAGNGGAAYDIDFLDLWPPQPEERDLVGDAHVYGGLTGDPDPIKGGLASADLVSALDQRQVQDALLVPFGSSAGLDTYGQLSDLALQHPDRFGVLYRAPAVFNDPDMIPYQLDQLEVLWQQGSLFGLKVHPAYELWPPIAVLRWLAQRSLLLMIHIRSRDDLERAHEIARESGISVLLSHFGGYPADRSRYESCIELMERLPNVFLVSSMVWLTHSLEKASLTRSGQVLLGSDFPAADPRAAAAALRAAGLTPEISSIVMGGNLRFLLDRVQQRRRAIMLHQNGLRFPPLPGSQDELASTGFEVISAGDLPDTEEQEAKRFWSDYGVRSWYEKPKPWAKHVADIARTLEPASILEFGCNIGRNLSAIATVLPECSVTGFDINSDAIAAGREATGFDLRLGDERSVADLGAEVFDFVFTVSVLDHVVDARSIATTLIRSARCYVLFIEVCLPVEGKVVRHFDHHLSKVCDSTGASYAWDLKDLLRSHPRVQRLETRPLYLHDRALGPYYRLYLAFLRPTESPFAHTQE